ncbi:MAG: secretion system protein E, partial [Pseudohongiella sp.]|nr:secretion system protein E [Pseudohongiella sp.]
MSEAPVKRKLGEVLLARGALTPDQLSIALLELKTSNKPLGSTLISLGFVTDSIVRDALSENTGQKSVDLTNLVLNADSIKFVPQEIARRYTVLPLSYDKSTHTLTLAMADTFNIVALDQILSINGGDLNITPVLGSEADIIRIIEQFYGF